MIAAPAILLVGGMPIGISTGLRDGIAAAAAHMTDRAACIANVLGARAPVATTSRGSLRALR
jgi:hypothetical protein